VKRVKAFIYILTKSLTSVDYYKDVVNTSLSFSLKYLAVLSAILILISATVGSVRASPELQKEVSGILNQVRQTYPADLVIKVQDSNWTVNRPQPFVVAMPANIKALVAQEYTYESTQTPSPAHVPNNLVVLDKAGTIDDLKKLDTLVLINDKNILTTDQDGNVQTSPLQNIQNFELNKTTFNNTITNIENLNKLLPIFAGGFLALSMAFYYAIRAIVYLGFLGIVIWVLSKLAGLKLNYVKAYKIGLHTMTAPLILETLFTILNVITLPSLWYFAVNFILVLVVLITLRKERNGIGGTASASGETLEAGKSQA
jgi:hypothetical protein